MIPALGAVPLAVAPLDVVQLTALRADGVVTWPCLSPESCGALCAVADAVYAEVARHPPPGYLPTAASVPVPDTAESPATLAPLAAALDALVAAALPGVRALLGSTARALPGQRWLRRQHPRHLAPAGHAPHGWHQDGALHFDFLHGPDPAEVAPRALLTLWVPLVPCGVEAPGLMVLRRRWPHLLAPAALVDAAEAMRWAEAGWTPSLAAGEALLFTGDLLHRTAVAPAMRRTRTSLELRFEAP